MSLKKDYPRLFQFFVCNFPDADFDGLTDEEVVVEYINDINGYNRAELAKIELEQTKKELTDLMDNVENYWQEVSKEANRYFKNAAEALEWLKKIKGWLEK